MSQSFKGILLVILGASFWGIGGTVSEQLFKQYQTPLDWFITFRLILSGVLLLTLASLNKQKPFRILKNKHAVFHLIIYSILGMFAVQYTFLAAIEAGNAAVATLLQYLAPIVILIYLLITKKTNFRLFDLIVILLSSIGTFLLLTSGDISSVSVSNRAIIFGILSAIASSFYTMYAGNLFRYYPSLTVIGFAMLFAGIIASIINRHWKMYLFDFDVIGIIYFLFVIVVGTALAFWLYLLSVKYIDPQITALLGCIEPLTAVILSIVWLKTPFNFIQFIGMIIIIGVVLSISIMNNKQTKTVQ